MPTFNFAEKDLNTLIQYFAGMSRMNYSLTKAHYKLDAELISVGKALSGPEAFNCFSCHLQNGAKPGEDPTNWAPDWVDMSNRLQYDFIAQWIANPSLFQKYAVMPAFLTKDDEAHPGYLGGKAELQINALRQYILSFNPTNR
jgi:mono/diheme cytochrome c family protein